MVEIVIEVFHEFREVAAREREGVHVGIIGGGPVRWLARRGMKRQVLPSEREAVGVSGFLP